jgi:hypothetical protein
MEARHMTKRTDFLSNLPANAFHRATREESAKLGVRFSSKRYIPNSIERITAKTRTISENQFRVKRQGVSVQRAIDERKTGMRPYASPAAHIRGQRAIERNRTDPIRAEVRKKREKGQRITEKKFRADNQRFLDAVGKKSGVRWTLVDGKWERKETGARPQELSEADFDRLGAHWRANNDFYGEDIEGDVFTNLSSPGVMRKTAWRRAA